MMADIKRICERADRRGPRLVSAIRGHGRLDGRAEGRLGELPRRKLHRAVPEPEAHARFSHVRAARQGGRRRPTRSRPFTTNRAIGASASRARPAIRCGRRPMRTFRSRAPISKATANFSSSTSMHRGIPLHEQTRELVCAHIERLWGHEVVLEENESGNKPRSTASKSDKYL